MSRYLVILDEYGMPIDILYSKKEILDYLNKEDDSETFEGEDKEISAEV